MRSLLSIRVLWLFSSSVAFSQVSVDWVAMYNGPSNNADFAYAMAIDNAGFTYVTGESYQGTNYNVVTIKLTPSGDTAWVRTYNGPGNSRDIGRAIRVDAGGNVYVTGESIGSGTNYDMVTIKYSAGGTELSVRRYNGTAFGDDGGADVGTDNMGNVFVTGYSDGNASPALRSDDYITIKYDSAGNQQWARRYSVGGDGGQHDVAKAIAVDASGNCYVTGRSTGSGSGYDYLTIRYGTNGDSTWSRRYNGAGNNTDDPFDIAVDGIGQVYVTGSSRSTSSNDDYLTIKYTPTGDTLWTRRYEGAGSLDLAYALALDATGNVFVTGESRGFGQIDPDYVTIKYNSLGDTLWTARYDGPLDSNDVPLALTVDHLGGVYVTGYSYGLTSGFDYATVKYNSNGIEQWVERYTTPGNSGDIAVGVAVDSALKVYVSGRGSVPSQGSNIITIKYSQGPTDVSSGWNELPKTPILLQNYPNPFNPSTTIRFAIAEPALVTLKVYDLLGREIALLLHDEMESGEFAVPFNASSITSGVYLVQLMAGDYTRVNKMVVLR